MAGEYEAMPPAMASKLRDFYAPYNALLKPMLNQDDFPWAR